MPTANDWVEETKHHLYSGYQEEINRLNGPLDATQVAVNLDFDPKGLSQGAVISVGLEEMYVWNVTGRSLQVQRGFNGTPKLAHAEDSLVTVKPKFSTYRIFLAVNNVLKELASPERGLFQVKTLDVPHNPASGFYDLPGDIISLMDVHYFDGIHDLYPVHQWDLVRNQDPLAVASGQALRIWDGMPGRNLRVRYRAPFTLLAGLDTDVTTTGLPDSAWDLPSLGAAVRLVPPRDVKRSFTEAQGEPRRANEVPIGAARQSASGIAALYEQRIVGERTRLQAKYPYVAA